MAVRLLHDTRMMPSHDSLAARESDILPKDNLLAKVARDGYKILSLAFHSFAIFKD